MGYSKIEAEKLNVFVPSAFSWPVLEKLGVSTFPRVFIAASANGHHVEFPVLEQHYFTAALALASSIFHNGWTTEIPRWKYEAVADRSAEINIINSVYANGGSTEDSTLRPLELLRLTAEELLSH